MRGDWPAVPRKLLSCVVAEVEYPVPVPPTAAVVPLVKKAMPFVLNWTAS